MDEKKQKFDMTKFSGILESSFHFWKKYYILVFFFLMFLSMGLGIYFWYRGLYIPVMEEQEKAEYKLTKGKGLAFPEKDFNESVEYIEQRKKEFEEPYVEKRDIFK